MEKSVEKQVKRFVELSLEFSASSEEAYGGFSYVYGTNISIGYINGNTACISNQYSTVAQKSKLEQYKDKLGEDASRAERYEEFIALQKNLKNYFDSLEKIIG